MDFMRIDRETCTKCGRCAADCPEGIIYFREGSYPRPIPPVQPLCIRCGHCVAVCPSGSFDHRDIPLDECVKLEKRLNITPEQCEQLIKGRRSVRKYKDQPVPREMIERLIDIARYAPTGHNNQEVEWLVIDDREKLRYMEDIGTEWFRTILDTRPQMAEAMNIEAALRRQQKSPDTFLRGAPVLVVTHASTSGIAGIDCTIALSYFDLAANSLGLGCCWAGFIYFMATSFPPMQEVLALPDGSTAGGCMMLGYPAYRYTAIPARQPARIIWQGQG